MVKVKTVFLILPVSRFDKKIFYPRGKKYLDLFLNIGIEKIYVIIWNNDGEQELIKFSDTVTIFRASKKSCIRGKFSINYIFSYMSFLNESKKFIKNNFNTDTDIVIGNKQHSEPLIYFALHNLSAKNVFLDISDIHSLDYKNKSSFPNRFAYKFINYFENKIKKRLSGLIVSSPGFSNYYFKKGFKKNIFEFENIPYYYTKEKLESDSVNKHIEINISKPKIGFVGSFRFFKNYFPIIKLAKEKLIHFIVYGIDVHTQLKKINEVCFHGHYTYKYEELKKIYSSFDINAIIYPDMGNPKYALPNKLYESIFFKKPILASKGTYLGEIVEKDGIGEVVDLKEPNTYKIKIGKIIKNYHGYLDNIEKIRDKYDYNKIKNQLISFIEGRINENNNTLGDIVKKGR